MSERAECNGVIPGTFVACGEAGNYCSERCLERARIRAAAERSIIDNAELLERLAKEPDDEQG